MSIAFAILGVLFAGLSLFFFHLATQWDRTALLWEDLAHYNPCYFADVDHAEAEARRLRFHAYLQVAMVVLMAILVYVTGA